MIDIIGIGPGNSLDYLTMEGFKKLKEADIGIYIGEMIGQEFIDLFSDKTLYYGRGISIDDVKDIINEKYPTCSIALMLPGDISLYSGQYNEQLCLDDYLKWFKESEYEYYLIPGISSMSAACAKLGIDLSYYNDNILITSFERLIDRLTYDEKKILAVFESKPNLILFQSFREWHRIIKLLQQSGYEDQTKIHLIYKLSWADEKIIQTTLKDVTANINSVNLNKHILIIILNKL